jgi:hypothetical protein
MEMLLLVLHERTPQVQGRNPKARCLSPQGLQSSKGKCDALKGHIYDSSDARQSDQYMKTTKEIAEYVGRTFKYGGDARSAVETLETPTVTLPPDPATEATRGEVRLWRKPLTSRPSEPLT